MKKDETITLYRRLGDSYRQQGLNHNALSCFQYLSELQPEKNSDWLYAQGLCFRQLGQWNKAIDCFRQSQLLQPTSDPWLYAEMAEAMQVLGQNESAELCWFAALQLAPEPWFYYQQISLLEQNDNHIKALQLGEQALEYVTETPDPALHVMLFRLYLNQHQLAQAVESLHKAYCLFSSEHRQIFLQQMSGLLSEQMNTVQQNYFLARLYAAYNPQESIAVMTDTLELEPEWLDLYFYRANIYFAIGHWRPSLSDLNHYLASFPANVFARGLKGLIHYELDELEEAVTDLDFSFQQNPLNTHCGHSLFAIYLEQRDFESATEMLAEIERREVTVYPLEEMQIRLEQLKGNIQKVLKRLEHANYRDDLYPRQLLILSRLYASMGEYEKAEDACMEAFDRSKKDECMTLSVVSLLLQFGQLEKAEDVFSFMRELPQQEYLRKWTHYLLSWVSLLKGELDTALIWIEYNLQTESGKGEPRDYMLMGYIHSWLGQYDEAEIAFGQAHTPHVCPDVQLNLAFCAFNI